MHCAAFDEVMEDPATHFFSHEGPPSTAAHRIVGKKLVEEIAAHPPAARWDPDGRSLSP
jgi:hypothetical protein